jgi:hypothetical protein
MQGRFARSSESLDERSTSLVGLQVWPMPSRFDWKGWLSNFPVERDAFFARCLLEAFLYYGPVQADALLLSAFHALSRDVCSGEDDPQVRRQLWVKFLDGVLISYVQGETPSPTDSGLGFARRSRILLGVPEERIVDPERAASSSRRLGIVAIHQLRRHSPIWRRRLSSPLGTYLL